MSDERATAGRDATGGRARAATVLVVEDDESFASLVVDTLERPPSASHVRVARNGAQAMRALREQRFDLVLLDRGLPDGDGLRTLRDALAAGVDARFVLLTADASAASAVEALRCGALDYVVKGPDALQRLEELAPRVLAGRSHGAATSGADALIGEGAAMATVRLLLRRYARSRACVLIEGETGVGKELVARALHLESPRAGGPFVPINCGALPEQLVESELFGHVRGAFTGAHRDHVGLVEHAERGTLFLDELEDLPLALQGKLLRLLQEAEYRPVGATRTRRADVRVVAASNAELHGMVAERRFRRDLFYRLNVLRIVVPPLRERLEDLPALIAHLAAAAITATGAGEPRALQAFVPPDAPQLARLRAHPWPGNVRELANLVERAAVLAASIGWSAAWPAVVAELDGVPVPASAPSVTTPSETGVDPEERATLVRLLERHRWRRAAAARELGISRVTLWRRMRRAGLTAADEEPPAARDDETSR